MRFVRAGIPTSYSQGTLSRRSEDFSCFSPIVRLCGTQNAFSLAQYPSLSPRPLNTDSQFQRSTKLFKNVSAMPDT